MKIKNQPKIIIKEFLGAKEYHLELPKEFELSWWYFHKYFRQVDGDTEKEQELINNFYKAYAELPDKYLKYAEECLLHLTLK